MMDCNTGPGLTIRPIMAPAEPMDYLGDGDADAVDDGADPDIDVGLVGIVERCYRCGKQHRAIAGIIVEQAVVRAYLGRSNDLFLAFEAVAEALQEALDPAWLRQHHIGPIQLRRSRPRPEGYVSNGCVWCDTIIGSSPLIEAIAEIGGERLPEHVFAHVLLPLDALRKAVGE
jgi:hypothetical protein